jgi:hypothetical protein
VTAVGQHGELHPVRAPVVEQRVDPGARRPARVEHVVDQHHAVLLQPERQVGAVDLWIGGPRGEVVAVERDVDVPERDLGVAEVADELMQPRREVGASAVDAHERHGAVGVLLHDLVRDPHERASDVVLVQDDAGLRHMDLPGLTGPG